MKNYFVGWLIAVPIIMLVMGFFYLMWLGGVYLYGIIPGPIIFVSVAILIISLAFSHEIADLGETIMTRHHS